MSKKLYLYIILVFILSIGTIIPFLREGFFEFHDNTAVVRVYEMAKSLSAGMFPVRWVADLGYGYGYPIYNFYAPLPYYIGGILTFFGLGSLLSTKIMIAFGVILSGITMFFFSRKFFGNYAGILSAVLYLYFPYHAVNIYVRGAVGELYAYAFLPLIFLGLFGLSQEMKLKELFGKISITFPIIFGVFLVAVSHNLSLIMILLLVIPTLIGLVLLTKNRINFVVISFCLIVIGLALSSFYIVPAFLEMDYTNVSSQIGGGADFRDHYVCISQLWESNWGFGGSVPGCVDGLSFKLGKFNIVLVFLVTVIVIYKLFKRKFGVEEKLVSIGLLLLLISVFLMTSASSFIWETIRYMEYIQYPWRFINFAGLFIAFIAGYLVFVIRKRQSLQLFALFLIVIVTIGYSYKYFTPQEFNKYSNAYYENREYITYTVSKISDEYLPKGFAKPQSYDEVPINKFELIEGEGIVNTLENMPNYSSASYALLSPGIVHIYTAYFPAWRAYVNGEESDLVINNNGIDVAVRAGQGDIELRFEQTLIQVLGNTITIIVFFSILIGIMLFKLYGKKTS